MVAQSNWLDSAGWQPIATMPNDGTRVLLYAPGERRPVDIGWQNKNGVLVFGSVFSFDLEYEITHWKPIGPLPFWVEPIKRKR